MYLLALRLPVTRGDLSFTNLLPHVFWHGSLFKPSWPRRLTMRDETIVAVTNVAVVEHVHSALTDIDVSLIRGVVRND